MGDNVKIRERDVVSVIIPCYKAENFLADIINDLKSQTYSNWELLVVSNGDGQEKQLEIANSYAKGDNRINVLMIPEGGVSKARNLGLTKAKGDYICFVDADDRLRPNHVEILYNAMEDDIDVVEGGFTAIDINGSRNIVTCPDYVCDLGLTGEGLFKNDISPTLEKLGNAPWNKLFRRSFLIDNNLFFDERFTMNEDRIHVMSSFLCARKWRFIPVTGYIYKASRGSAMSRYHNNIELSWETYISKKNKIKLRMGFTQQMLEKEYTDMKYYLVWQYIWNIFKSGCPLSYKDKIKYINRMINDSDFKTSCENHDWGKESLRYKLFNLVTRTRSAHIVAYLFLCQHHGKQLFNIIKK